MQLRQPYTITFTHLKVLKLNETVMELCNVYGHDVYHQPSRNIGFIKSSSREPISKGSMLTDDRLSAMSTQKSCRFFGNMGFPERAQLLAPWTFLHLRHILI
jgi:hypothetical protein